MIQNSGENKLARASLITFVGVVLAFVSKSALAQSQIVPDDTLGDESSQVRNNVEVKGVPSEVIEGGAQRGANLFHSFSEFNVREGRGAYFANPAGIEHILGRVTGANPSEILGTLGVLGNADLFLINPNGIIFGENARLDVAGSFVGTTADSVVFDNGFEFSASNPQTPPLLTVNVPMGLQYGNNGGSIQVQGNSQGTRKSTDTDLIDTNEALRVGSDETLALVGGDLFLEGATLKTAGGRIELGSVTSPSTVSLTPIEKGWALGYENVQNFGNIQLSQQTAVDASGAGAGYVQVQGRHVRLTGGSQIETSTLGSESGGTLAVNASESVEITGESANEEFSSGLFAVVHTSATGDGGNLQINTKQLYLADGAFISVSTRGEGDAGMARIRALDSVLFDGEGGNGSLVNVVFSDAKGNTRGIRIETDSLTLKNGAQIGTTTTGKGDAGAIEIKARDSVLLEGEDSQGKISAVVSQVFPQAKGNAGEIAIETSSLTLRNGTVISASTFGEGNAGAVRIQAQDLILFEGVSSLGRGSLVDSSVQSQAKGNAGGITIETDSLTLRNGAQIFTSILFSAEGNSDLVEIQYCSFNN